MAHTGIGSSIRYISLNQQSGYALNLPSHDTHEYVLRALNAIQAIEQRRVERQRANERFDRELALMAQSNMCITECEKVAMRVAETVLED